MSYKILYHRYFKQVNACTETKYFRYYGNENFDLEAIKSILDNWLIDSVGISESVIRYQNGDEIWFNIEYNGKWCKKYRNGIND